MQKLLKINNINQKVTNMEDAADRVASDSDDESTKTGLSEENKIDLFD